MSLSEISSEIFSREKKQLSAERSETTCCSGAVSVPVVGLGGVSSAEDVIEMMLAGATAVEVGAANLIDPYACKNIIEALPATMDKYRIENLADIIGGCHNE